ncbi:MAG: hypothetical protein ACOZCL_10270 [Bacillota bacterium]
MPITIEEFELKKQAYKLEGYVMDESDNAKALLRIARMKVLFEMAKSEGLTVTFEEAQKSSFDERSNLLRDEKAASAMENYINSLGLTSDEYWNEYHANELVLFISINRLKGKPIKDAIADGKLVEIKSDNTSVMPEEYAKYMDKYIKNLEKDIKIEIKNESYREKIKM